MPEENNIILTQKIRNPKAEKNENEDKWIDIFKVDKDKNIFINAIVTTGNLEDGSVTYDKMYIGNDSNLKPVRSNTIQDGAINSAAMYKISDEILGKDADTRPVSTDTIQKNAITDSKIQDETITLRKLGEPLARQKELKIYGKQHYDNDTLGNYKIVFYSQDIQDSDMINKWQHKTL